MCKDHEYLDQNYKVNVSLVGLCSISFASILIVSIFKAKQNGQIQKAFIGMLISFAVMFGVQIFTYHERALHFKSEARCINPNTELSKFVTTVLTVVPRGAYGVGSFFNLDYWITKYMMLERPICEFYNEPFDSARNEKRLTIVHTIIGGLILFQIGESALYLIKPD